jgi:glutamyl-tRNA synthetase
MPVIGRLAPSPTGAQHIGNARTYLIAWLSARAAGGSVRLRIEDIDVWRNKPDAVTQALDDLAKLGLDFDGEVVVQSTRLEAHLAALEELKGLELVYPCTCSRTDIASAAGAPHAEHEGPAYPGTCAHRSASDAAKLDKPYAWRFRVTTSPAYVDGFRGLMQVNLKELGGDFVVWRSFRVPAYQLAVVVDDADMGITEVIRGDDLVPSTPRQLLLYAALNRTQPTFTHVPLVVGTDGRRLAKRHGDTRLQTLWKAGITPEKLLGHLAHSCGWLTNPEPITARELIPLFTLNTIPHAPWVFSEATLSEAER